MLDELCSGVNDAGRRRRFRGDMTEVRASESLSVRNGIEGFDTGRIVIVSNRLPVRIVKGIEVQPSVGGLATGLLPIHSKYRCVWIGWPGIAYERIRGYEDEIEERLRSEGYHPVFLTQRDVEEYYYGFCNKTIWPLFHYFTQYAVYDKRLYEAYKNVNEKFLEAVLDVVEEGDVLWIHDYHLMLLPKLVRDEIPDLKIGFFLHIPFPSFEVFRLLPWRREILEGMLGADLIGFHTYDYVRHFIESVRRILGYDHFLGQITTKDRVVRVDAFPMGIDYKRFGSKEDSVLREMERIRRKSKGCRIILSIDRLDYTKGIPQRLEAFDLFLERYPEFRERVILILITVPSRTGVEQYKELKRRIDELVGRINGKYGTINWIPVWYISRFVPFQTLLALYRVADVALITPLRDGMNLIAKEFVASKTNGRGVLILSEMAGASKELIEAIVVNPNNVEEVAEAIRVALTMPEEEQVRRNRAMQERIKRYDVRRWFKDFMEKLDEVKDVQRRFKVRVLTKELEDKIVEDYMRSESRLILLDYDGTLVPFAERPEEAKPDEELMEIIKGLSENPKNEIVIVSGRDRETLERWFGGLNVGIIAEHGVWIKREGTWETVEELKSDWKREIRQILELYAERTPGAFIEEKDYSLVWHYRRVDPDLASIRARELKEILLNLTANLNLEVLEGSKVIEVKSVGVNKGRAVMKWILQDDWDFILAVGDDWTDEDMFSVLPREAYSIKVGLIPTKARFNVRSYRDVRKLLKRLI